MTYSTDQQVYGLAQKYCFETKEITMQNAHHADNERVADFPQIGLGWMML